MEQQNQSKPNAAVTEKPSEKHWFEVIAIISSCWAALTIGLLISWPSPSIPKIINDNSTYDISLEEASYFTVVPPIGAIISSFGFAYLADKIGRKWTLILIAIPQTASLLLIANARSVWVFYVARGLGGFGEACFFAAIPSYIGEISTPKVRGSWGNLMTLNVYVGQFLMNIYGSYASIEIAAYISLSVPILFLATFIWMPESPYYLLMRGRVDAARASLKRLRRRDDVEAELAAIKAAIERQLAEKGKWCDLCKVRANRRAMLACIFLRLAQQFGGITTMMVYSQLIFHKSGTEVSASVCAIVLAGLSAVFNGISSFVLDYIGRRWAFFWSLLGTSVAFCIFFVYFLLDEVTDAVNVHSVNWVPLVAAGIWVIASATGMGLVPTLMVGELFSVSIKRKALVVMSFTFALSVSGSTKAFQLLWTYVSTYSPFLFFTVVCLLSATLTMYIVPETKGKTLEEIQQDLRGETG